VRKLNTRDAVRKSILKRFYELGIISHEPVRLRSGALSSFYCDIKKAYGYPEVLGALTDLIGTRLTSQENCIAVSGYGGLPLGAAVAVKYKRHLVLVRDSEKSHGKGGLIDGYIPKRGDHVVILDDVLTSGGSIRSTLKSLRKTNATIGRAIVVVERKKAKLSVPYTALFTLQELGSSNHDNY
jgi:orotate phosphoribosyltransferase